MNLSDRDILDAIEAKTIVIQPFDKESLGGDSYDVRLAATLMTYDLKYHDVYKDELHIAPEGGFETVKVRHLERILDCAEANPVTEHVIGDDGFVLYPNTLYLGSTVEYTEMHKHLPLINGKSSIGRLGLSVHITAGTGDVGFCGHWTLEMTVVHPLRVYKNMKIAQLLFFEKKSPPLVDYQNKKDAKYSKQGNFQKDPKPVPSEMWRNFPKK